jgi:hypothetical protein
MRLYRNSLQCGNSFAARVRRMRWAAMLIALSILSGATFAARADDDLPGRVGRIADFGGQLFLSLEDRAAEWQPVGLNYPVTSGDNLWVGADGRAEVDYGGGQFRLAGDTNLHVSRLDENRIALFIAQGRVIMRVRVLDAGDSARVDAPNTQIQLTRPGLYRIDVSPDRQNTTVVVREGEAVVGLAGGSQQALPGQMVLVVGPDPVAADVRNGIGQDGFDTWSADRDRRYERPSATAYVSRQMVGYADLDEYGSWQAAPEYGPVWYPASVAADWAPYRDGYWTSVGGWGTTWVDAAPWGYAPFHYGRWMRIGGRWGWCPGAYVSRPIWAPALVGWYGGAGWGMSMNFGSPVYGWVPLGWGDAYHPWWRRCSYNCWATYNRPYAVDVAARPKYPPGQYRNTGVPGAATVVAGATLSGHLPVAANRVSVPVQQLATAPVLAAAPAVVSGPLHIPGARSGIAGTPPPASTYYPVSRAGRLGGEPGSRSPAPFAAGEVPAPATTAGRPAAVTSPATTLAPGTIPTRVRPAPSAEPGASARTAAAPSAPAAGGSPSAKGEDVRRQRVQQPVADTVPQAASQPATGTSAPLARPARPPASEKIAPMPTQPSRGVPVAAPAAAGAPAQAQVPAGRAVVQGAPVPAHAGGQPEHAGQAKQAVPKGEAVPATPAKQ